MKDGARVHFHAYTSETIAEARLYGTKLLKPGEEAFAQLQVGRARAARAGRPFHRAAVFTGGDDWWRSSAGCAAANSQAHVRGSR